ncbi:DUF4041 domain-containing protein [[Clostridium] colinum]|uniref:DUF4041 domain-containing protein n=1 Tax=[Clostridium] colinum TaxID=36835 RepID=UPI002024CE7E|nr:DUF4041 domain-containing protein [[Clostridium] colinum]
MSILDIFKIKEFKEKINNLENELKDIKEKITPEIQQTIDFKKIINELNYEIESKNDELNKVNSKIENLNEIIYQKEKELVITDEKILMQEFNLYEPRFDFCNSDLYKSEIDDIRSQQKNLIKNDFAVNSATDWTVNGSKTEGKKMIKDMKKLLLRAFNSECDEIVSKVKYNNFDQSLKRLQKSKETISKLGKIMNINISASYYNLKVDELSLALEYKQIKQKEKEEERERREALREAERVEKEIKEKRLAIEKEQKQYQKELDRVKQKLEKCNSEEEKIILQEKLNELNVNLKEIEQIFEDLDYREANKRAGYVYIISNIGAFGENIFKIGLTRRLEPLERITELSGASVPFKFDLHALIFSEDAPALESALHKAFNKDRVNLINNRKEFFRTTLEEIEKVVKQNYDKTVEFNRIADAQEYRESIQILKNIENEA